MLLTTISLSTNASLSHWYGQGSTTSILRTFRVSIRTISAPFVGRSSFILQNSTYAPQQGWMRVVEKDVERMGIQIGEVARMKLL